MGGKIGERYTRDNIKFSEAMGVQKAYRGGKSYRG